MSGFSINGVTIQGFKGFSEEKSIQLDGKHLFILGPNGKGKSSMIEAIRWCLFGQLWRPNETVSNRLFPSECIVTLELNRDGSIWNLRRRLSQGITGGSDAILKDDNGVEHKSSDILPQLSSVKTGESMHIICSSQNPRHRLIDDLEAFERTILAYLGLSETRVFIKKLEDNIELFEKKREEISNNISTAEEEINGKLEDIYNDRRELLGVLDDEYFSPVIIHERIVDALKKLDFKHFDDSQSNEELLEIFKNFISKEEKTSYADKRTQVEQIRNDIDNIRANIQGLNDLYSDRNRYLASMETIQAEIDELRNGNSIEELEHNKAEQDKINEKNNFKMEILELVKKLFNSLSSKNVNCPVCEARIGNKQGFLQRINNKISAVTNEDRKQTLARNHLNDTLNKIKELTNQYKERENSKSQIESEIQSTLDRKENASIQDLENKKSEKIMILREQEALLEDHERKINDYKKTYSYLHTNIKIHELNNKIEDYKKKTENLDECKGDFRLLNEFLENVKIIKDILNDTYIERIKTTLPELNNKLTNSFKSLTHHGSFDNLIISNESLPDLKIKVKSNSNLDLEFEPDQVLNGQAVSAIQVVPYFAFSEMTGLAIEIHTILLDDPTQSYDKKHIGILLDNFARLGRKAQLIIGSHEIETFKEFVPIYFDKKSYKLIEILDHKPETGPIWKIQND